MKPDSDTGGQEARMRAAIGEAVSIAPQFLRGEIDADRMAHTMVDAVRRYAEHEQAAGGVRHGAEVEHLQHALAELMGCGSGYLAGRCDAA